MIIKKGICLENFEFWSGAKYIANLMKSDDFAVIEELLEELYPDGMEEMEVNDFFWFDGDTIAQALGYEDEEDMLEKKVLPK